MLSKGNIDIANGSINLLVLYVLWECEVDFVPSSNAKVSVH